MLLVAAFVLLTGNPTVAARYTLDDIEQRQAQTAHQLSSISIKIKASRSSSMGPDELIRYLGWADYDAIDFFADRTITYRWQEAMVYEYTSCIQVILEETGSKSFKAERSYPSGRATAFNGELVFQADDEQLTTDGRMIPMLYINPNAEPVSFKTSWQILRPEYFEYAGFWLPHAASELGQDVIPVLKQMRAKGARIEIKTEANAQKIVEVVAELGGNRATFRFDPERAFSQIEREDIQLDTGVKLRTITASDFEKVAGRELYLPHRIEIKNYIHAGKRTQSAHPLFVESLAVEGVETRAMPKSDFAIDYVLPKSHVVDYRKPDIRKSRRGQQVSEYRASIRIAFWDQVRNWSLSFTALIVVVLSAAVIRRRMSSATNGIA